MFLETESTPTIVLDDECLNTKDLSCSLMGRVKEFTSLSNLKKVLCNEGFDVLKISYLGGRIAWVEVEGIPFKLWSGHTFNHIASKWGKLMKVDDYDDTNFHSKRLCILTKVYQNILESFKIVFREEEEEDDVSVEDNHGGIHSDQEINNYNDKSDVEEVPKTCFNVPEGQKGNPSEDPFGIYPLLNKDKNIREHKINEDGENLNEGHLDGGCAKKVNEEVTGDDNSFVHTVGGIKFMIVVVYAPQEASEKCMLWDYLTHVSDQWDGEIVMMGDFNEVRYKSERFGSNFKAHDPDIFNSFIHNAVLNEVHLGVSAFTWCHKSATKMSKFDRFLVFANLLHSCSNINAISLDRYISDHRPILLREAIFDYGPIPFRFYNYWLEVDGFDKLVRDAWNDAPGWLSTYRLNSRGALAKLKEDLKMFDEAIDKGNSPVEMVHKRLETLNKIQQGIMVNGTWIDDPVKVKYEFLDHFRNRFDKPPENRARIDICFPNVLSNDQRDDWNVWS
nr:RNA-directed DNA polymerase, eukaryota [Tanacetum cinerariifolium]